VTEGDLPPRLEQKCIIGQLSFSYVTVRVEVESDLTSGRRVSLLIQQLHFNFKRTVEKYVPAKFLQLFDSFDLLFSIL
jgi:hypothetical protein